MSFKALNRFEICIFSISTRWCLVHLDERVGHIKARPVILTKEMCPSSMLLQDRYYQNFTFVYAFNPDLSVFRLFAGLKSEMLSVCFVPGAIHNGLLELFR